MPPPVDAKSVYQVILERMRQADASSSYVARLVAAGEDAILKKIGEEACEVLLAAKGSDRQAVIHEIADLQFHLMIWMARTGITPEDIEQELGARFGRSGLERHETP